CLKGREFFFFSLLLSLLLVLLVLVLLLSFCAPDVGGIGVVSLWLRAGRHACQDDGSMSPSHPLFRESSASVPLGMRSLSIAVRFQAAGFQARGFGCRKKYTRWRMYAWTVRSMLVVFARAVDFSRIARSSAVSRRRGCPEEVAPGLISQTIVRHSCTTTRTQPSRNHKSHARDG
ncbi:unnamed protein product, partial [Scytosiphon promiscuus]